MRDDDFAWDDDKAAPKATHGISFEVPTNNSPTLSISRSARSALRDWEQGRKEPDAAARAYLHVIAREPKTARKALERGRAA